MPSPPAGPKPSQCARRRGPRCGGTMNVCDSLVLISYADIGRKLARHLLVAEQQARDMRVITDRLRKRATRFRAIAALPKHQQRPRPTPGGCAILVTLH